jgi:predicted dehydrogenase
MGTGGIAREHAGALAQIDGTEIVGVTDAVASAAEDFSSKHGGKVYANVNELLADLKPDCLYITSPNFARGEGERAALKHGIPFFIEKPMGNDTGMLNEVASEVTKSGLMTCAAYMNRYREGVNKVKAMIEKEPAILGYGGWWGGSPGNHPWWTDKSKSGGQMHEQCTHTVDLCRYFFGEPVEVYSAGVTGFNKGIPNYSMEDASTMVVRFANGGVVNLMSSCSSNAGGGIFLNIHGLNHNYKFSEWRHDVVIKGKDEEPVEISAEPDIFVIEDTAFITAVRTGNKATIRSDYADGVKSALITIGANKSIETGKPVAL